MYTMSFNPEVVAQELPALKLEITLDSLTRVTLRDSLIAYIQQVVQQYVESPAALIDFNSVDEATWQANTDLRQQFMVLQDQLVNQILQMPSIIAAKSVSTGNTIPYYIRSMVAQAYDSAVKSLIEV